MTDDEAFVRAIVAAPADDAPRLVYADWLDERGDPRGAYVRAEVTTFHYLPESRARSSAMAQLMDIAGSLDPIWVARISRPPAGVCCDRIQFVESGPVLSRDDLWDLQSRLRVPFPPQYTAFLLNQNGGYPRSRRFRPDIDFLTAESCEDVKGFARVGGDRSDLPRVEVSAIADDDASEEDFPLLTDLLTIAAPLGRGEFVFMVTQGERRGRILRPTSNEHEEDEPGGLAEWFPSLGAMLANLRIRRAGVAGYVTTN